MTTHAPWPYEGHYPGRDALIEWLEDQIAEHTDKVDYDMPLGRTPIGNAWAQRLPYLHGLLRHLTREQR